jgi:hypothetical protein
MTRTHFNWYRGQPFPDSPLDFAFFDNNVAQIQEADLEIVGILTPKGPLERAITPDESQCAFEFKCFKLAENGIILPECEDYTPDQERMYRPTDMNAWGLFVRAVVERYDGDGIEDMPGLTRPVRVWQLGNEYPRVWCSYDAEPGADFTDLMRQTWAFVAEADPGATFVIPGIATDRGLILALADGYLGDGPIVIRGRETTRQEVLQWEGLPGLRELVETVLRTGEFDIAEIHLYGLYGLIPERLTWLRDQLSHNENFVDSQQNTVPVWVLEGGGPFAPTGETFRQPEDPPTEPNEELIRENASYVSKYYLTGIAHNAEVIGWTLPSEYDDWGPDFGDLDLLNHDGSPRPSYHAYRLLTGLINGDSTVARLPDRNGATLYKILDSSNEPFNRAIYAVWSDDALTIVDLSAEVGSAPYKIYRLPVAQGEIDPVPLDMNPASLVAQRVPVFLEIDLVPEIFIDPSSHDFGIVEVGTVSTPLSFTISNTGNADLVIGRIALTGPDATEFFTQNDTCSEQTLTPAQTCTIEAIFAPTSPGAKFSNLLIPSNDPEIPLFDVGLSGEGLLPAPVLTQGPLVRGLETEFHVTNSLPSDQVVFLFSLTGIEDNGGPCPPILGGLCVDLLDPRILGNTRADASGTATLTRRIPLTAPIGQEIFTQAIIPRDSDSVKSNTVTDTVIDPIK